MNYLTEEWHDLPWSDWHEPRKLHKDTDLKHGVPDDSSLYRIRIGNILAYIGESTGLTRRLVDNWGDVNQTGGRPSRGREDVFRHVAEITCRMEGSCIISWVTESGGWPYDFSSKREGKS